MWGNRKNSNGYKLSEMLNKELVGQRIYKITNNTIELENGTILTIDPNKGCDVCNAGWAEMNITPSNPYFDAAVMNVEYKDMSNKRSDSFKIFIYMADNSSVTMNGNNGNDNGYYGSGFWVSVTR